MQITALVLLCEPVPFWKCINKHPDVIQCILTAAPQLRLTELNTEDLHCHLASGFG